MMENHQSSYRLMTRNESDEDFTSRGVPPWRRLVRADRMRLPLRKGYLVADMFKIIACVATAGCILQVVWIQRIHAGLARVANDPFDSWFGQDITRSSPSIWDEDRQSFLRNIYPVPIHSHNDYARRIPLFEALGSGCISVEADIHLVDSELLVGHSAKGLDRNANLRSMYLDPLQRMLERQNSRKSRNQYRGRGLFNHAPEQTMVLLVDHKTDGAATLAELDAQLIPLRDLDYLTYWNGTDLAMRPLTIVATGNVPFDAICALNDTHRDIFWDAPLEQLTSVEDDFTSEPPVYAYNQSNSYYASTRWQNLGLVVWRDPSRPPPVTAWEKDQAATQIERAASRGLLTRYWDTPSGPPNLRDIVWRVLVDAKVGVINMDDMGVVRDRTRGWDPTRRPG